ncbi:MAG: DMT family transporter [Clostridiales bacterium]|nr:DMT family transporter [Clostridiales bacterium]
MNESKAAAFYQKPAHIVLLALCATMLWGAAFPSVKLGYAAFQVDTASPACLMVFAGTRFTLAGLATLALCGLLHCQLPIPHRDDGPGIVAIGLVQTAGQYLFYYIGLAHTTGVRASILNAASAFLTVLLSALIWRKKEPMTAKKWLGCLMGLAGVVLVNLGGSLGEQPFALLGEGMLLLSVFFVSAGAICSKVLTQGRDPFLITGWQLTLGGGVLLGAGLLLGGTIGALTSAGAGLMAWLVAISAVGFTLWTFLLKYNPVGKIAVFSFLTPVFGALLSSLVLGESLLSPATVLALALVAGGIVVVNR